MNRSILIVICDFLLLSLLTFSTDLSKMAGENEGSAASVKVDVMPKTGDNNSKDLAAVMKLAQLTRKAATSMSVQRCAARSSMPISSPTFRPATAAGPRGSTAPITARTGNPTRSASLKLEQNSSKRSRISSRPRGASRRGRP